MKILHIGDFHFKGGKKHEFDQNLVVEKLLESLKDRKTKIDYIFFTGDLVNNGSNPDHFNMAHDLLFGNMIKQLGVDPANIFICPGNHDVDWNECSKAIITYFDAQINSNEKLSDYYSRQNNKDLENSYLPLRNYSNYCKRKFDFSADIVHPLFTVHKREFQRIRIGIATLNSPWLCSNIEGRADERQLLIPVAAVKEVLNEVRDCKAKILLIHHPFYWLKEWNDLAIEDLVHSNFNLMFSGHIHKEKIETKFNANNGIFCNTSQAVLTFDIDGQIGYSLLDFDLEDVHSVTVDRSYYLQKEKKFVTLESVCVVIPQGETKNRQNKLRQKVSAKFPIELQNANELLLNFDGDDGLNFIESFTSPVLSSSSDVDAYTREKDSLLQFNKLLELGENYLIFGRDKSGKTSVLKMIQLQLLRSYTKIGLAPFYINYKDLEHKDGDYDIYKSIEHYFQINKNDAIELINAERLVLLIDNLNTAYPIHQIIMEFLSKNHKVKYVICSDWLTTRVFLDGLDGLKFTKLFFHELSRKEIRIFASKQRHLNSTDKEQVLDKVAQLCKQLQLPVNYWTVSLILLIYKKSNDDYHKNLFGILDLCVDEFLNKRRLSISRGNLAFEQYKEICSKIARYLLIAHKANVYSASYGEMMAFLESLIMENSRIVGEPKDILDFLLETAILKRKNDRYTFRLNGIFEYFLAYHIKENPKFREEILNDDSIFLAFKNELEIYSGFVRNDEQFLLKLFGKTQKRFESVLLKYKELGTLDSTLSAKLGEATDFAEKIKRIKLEQALTHEDQDSAKDGYDPLKTDSEVQLKKIYDVNAENFEIMERFISIMARVFRNSDRISDQSVVEKIFDYLLDAYCYIGIYLIDAFEEFAKAENLKKEVELSNGTIIGEDLLKMVARFVPVLSQTSFYNGVGQPNMKNMIKLKISKLEADVESNQFKLFVLYFLLMDIDDSEVREYIGSVFDNITLASLKVSTFFKLSYYLAFKAYNNRERENYYRNLVQEANIKMDSRNNPNSIQKSLANATQKNLVKRQKIK